MTKKIEIVSTPRGSAPLKMREAWIGCILPVHWQLQHGDKRGGFAVEPECAIKILRTISPIAAAWWAENKFHHPTYGITFESECCKVLYNPKVRKKPPPI